MTSFQPSDGDEFIKDEPPLTTELGEVRGFNFSRLKQGMALIYLSTLITDMTLR
jgi:hypothetical protein